MLYQFIGEGAVYAKADLMTLLELHGLDGKEIELTLSHLLYFGFFGVRPNGEGKYIWDYGYNMRLLGAVIDKGGSGLMFVLNPAFYAALGIAEPLQG